MRTLNELLNSDFDSLQRLDLSTIDLPAEDRIRLFYKLEFNKTITYLNLSGCQDISGDGIQFIASVIRINRTLRQIDLSNVALTFFDLKVLFNALEGNLTLEGIIVDTRPQDRLYTIIRDLLNKKLRSFTPRTKNLLTILRELNDLNHIDTVLDLTDVMFHAYTHRKTIPCDETIYALATVNEHTIAYSPTSDGTIHLHDLTNPRNLQTLRGHTGKIYALLKLPNNRLASASRDCTVRIWNLNTKESISLPSKFWVYALAASPNGNLVVSGGLEYMVRVWNISDRSDIYEPFMLNEHIYSLAFMVQNNRSYVIAGTQNSLKKICLNDRRIEDLPITRGPCFALTTIPNTSLFVSGSNDAVVRIWELGENGRCRLKQKLIGHNKAILALGITPNNELVSADNDNLIVTWDLTTGSFLRVLHGHSNRVNAICILPNGSIISGSGSVVDYMRERDKSVRVWHYEYNVPFEHDFQIIFSVLEHNPKIREVNLNGCLLGTVGVEALSQLLTKHKSIRVLDLNNTGMTEKQDHMLQAKVKKNASDTLPTTQILGNTLIPANDKRVTVRIWYGSTRTSTFFQFPRIGFSVGHVSVETYGPNRIYASFWPRTEDYRKLLPRGVDPCHNASLEIDRKLEGKIGSPRDPDVEIHLDSLDAQAINNAYRIFQAANYNWSIFGSSALSNTKARNCAGLSYFLLLQGGIDKLLKGYYEKHKGIGQQLGSYAVYGFTGLYALAGIISVLHTGDYSGLNNIVDRDTVVDMAINEGDPDSMNRGADFGGLLGRLSDLGFYASNLLVLTPNEVANIVTYARNFEQENYQHDRSNNMTPNYRRR